MLGKRELAIQLARENPSALKNDATVMPNAGLGRATALTNAVWGGHKEVVELLLRRGASTDVTGGKFYRTILDYARANSRPEIVSLLENPPR